MIPARIWGHTVGAIDSKAKYVDRVAATIFLEVKLVAIERELVTSCFVERAKCCWVGEKSVMGNGQRASSFSQQPVGRFAH